MDTDNMETDYMNADKMDTDKTRDRIIREAVFSDETENFRTPLFVKSGEKMCIKLRTAKEDVDKVLIVLCSNSPEGSCEKTELPMEKTESDKYFDCYSAELTVGEEEFRYCFRLIKAEESIVYSKAGCTDEYEFRDLFSVIPDFSVPEWLIGAVIYQIFTDRFYNGDEENDVRDGEYTYLEEEARRAESWDSPVSAFDVARFYGGDIKGIEKKLGYLKELGIEAIYLNPIFVSPSNHKYDCQDYEHIDPHLGVVLEGESYEDISTSRLNLRESDRCFREFVEKCHEAGIRVIVDGVFNHCGSFNHMMNRERLYKPENGYEKGAYESRDSAFHDFFNFEKDTEADWPDNDSYEKWWGMETLPKLNYESAGKCEKYIFDIARRWIKPPYSADGWRLDVAADLGHSEDYNHSFWKRFRKTVKKVNPEACIIAEHYGDAGAWLRGDEWDTVMNYDAFMEPVSRFLTGMEKHSDDYSEEMCGNGDLFFDTLFNAQKSFGVLSLYSAMNELSNHDHSRFLTRTNKKVGRLATMGAEEAGKDINYGLFSAGVIMQMTLPGAPTIYYGDEVGVCGWTDPDSRRSYPWGRENHQLLDFHTYMIALHKNDVFRRGSLIKLFSRRFIIAYGRMLGKHAAVVVVNAGDSKQEIRLPLWKLGIDDNMTVTRVMEADSSRYNVGLYHRGTKNGELRCTLAPYSAKVYINWAEEEYDLENVEREI